MFGLGIFVFALTQHVLPRVPELPSIPAFEWSWAASNPTVTMILAGLIVLGRLLAAGARKVAGKRLRRARAAGVHDPAHAAPLHPRSRIPQVVGWGCRVASAAAFLEAFAIPGTLRNALLVMVVGSLTTVLPVTPGGVGTQQALIVVVLGRHGGERRSAAVLLDRHAGGGLRSPTP